MNGVTRRASWLTLTPRPTFIACAGRPQVPIAPLIFFAAAAIGIETVTLTRVRRIRVDAVHTGSVSKFSETVTAQLSWAWDRTRRRFRRRRFARAACHAAPGNRASLCRDRRSLVGVPPWRAVRRREE